MAIWVVDEERPEFVWEGQNDMPVVTVEEFFGHCLGPDVGMFFAARGAELAFTAKVDDLYFTAMRANESREAAVLGAAVEHFFGFLEDMLRKPILVELFKEGPIIITSEDRFKGEVTAHDNWDYIKDVKL